MQEFYTVNQVAIILKVHPLTIRRYIKEGKLKAFKVGGSIRIAAGEIHNFTQNFVPNFVPKNKVQKQPLKKTSSGKAFSFSDPIFRLKARGINMSKLEQ